MGPLPPNMKPVSSPLTSPKRSETKPDIRQVILGDVLFDTWFPSFYPSELVGKGPGRLYVCPCCFKYTIEQHLHLAHLKHCFNQKHGPQGRLIYRDGPLAIYEIDGESEQLYAQNLSLFAKLFLDNKSVFFDVASFNYYVLIHRTKNANVEAPHQVLGFFSKEKMSWDNNNLACILIFPPWQRKGLGKILMGVSYELSKREGRYGGPEKPLSDLGMRGYMQFWEARIARTILSVKGTKSLTAAEVAKESWVLTDDVIASLKRMGVTGTQGEDGSIGISKNAVRDWAVRTGVDFTPPFCESALSLEEE